MTGKTISHFKVLEKLGGGGMGVVYLADDLELKRKAALKFLPPHLSTDLEANQRFVQEAQAASALNQPNVCTVYEIGHTEEGQTFIAMALYEGETLKQKLASGPVPPEEAADLARQIAEGLAAAHEQGIIHRDIKPANIFITRRGRAVILDFGLAKLTGSLDLTKSGSTLGTAHYMSPEQIRNEEVDHRTDIWSLGVVLYEMLAGKRPFDGDYEQAISYAILNEEVASLPDAPAEMRALVKRMLSKTPGLRPLEAAEVVSVVGAFAAGHSRQTDVLTSAVALTGSRRKAPWMVAAGVLIAAMVVVFFMMRSGAPADYEPIVRQGLAVFPFSVRGDPELDYLSEGMVDLLSAVLDGAGDLRAVDPYLVIGEIHRSGEKVQDPVSAVTLARKLQASSFILGNVLRVGQRIRMSASQYDEDGDVLARAEEEISTEDELLPAVDRLAQALIASHLGSEDSAGLSVAAMTTSSIDALKTYLEGERALRTGSYEDAVEALRKATDLDSTFALAHYRLGHALGWSDRHVDGVWHSLKAAQYADDLPDRYRKLVLADAAHYAGDMEGAERIYRSLVSDYPNDAHAWYALGDLIWHAGPLHGRTRASARGALEKAFSLDSNHSEVLYHLIDLATSERRFTTADSLIVLFQDEERRRRFTLRVELARSPDTPSRDSIRKVVELEKPRTVWSVAGSVASRNTGLGPRSPDNDDLKVGELLYRSLLDRPDLDGDPSFYAWRYGLQHLRRTGRMDEVRQYMERPARDSRDAVLERKVYVAVSPLGPVMTDELQAIRETILTDYPRSPETWGWRWKDQVEVYRALMAGMLSVRMNEWTSVEAQAVVLRERAIIDGEGSYADGFATTLEAYIAWNNGDRSSARKLLSEVHIPYTVEWDWWDSHIYDRHLKAIILMEERKYAEALDVWESLVSTHRTVYLTPSYLYRAQCYEGLGETDRAIGFYQLLVDLWKDADTELQPMVDEARSGLKRLLEGQIREPS